MRRLAPSLLALAAILLLGAPLAPAPVHADDAAPHWWTPKQRASLLKAGLAMRAHVDPVVALDTYALEGLIDVSDSWPPGWAVWAQLHEAKATTGWDEARTLLDLTRTIATTGPSEARSRFAPALIELIENGDTTSKLVPRSDAETAEVEAAHVVERSIAAALDLFFVENQELPATLESLVLPSRRTNAPMLVRVPKDPWGEAYQYRILRVGTSDYSITSKGPDRRLGTTDDVVYPEPGAK